jgi:maltose alpha-D-glucosyltransferase/alpha-amylase
MQDPYRLLTSGLIHSLASSLPSQRWFAGKGKQIEKVALFDAVLLSDAGADPTYAACLANVSFASGMPETYFVPIALSRQHLEATQMGESDGVTAYDALGSADFRRRWLELLLGGSALSGNSGRLEFQMSAKAPQLFPELPAVMRAGRGRLSKAEQSNSALIYSDSAGADRFILKMFRRLMPGLNPDLEVTGYITEHTSFRNVPLLTGSVEYVDAAGERMTVAVLQQFVANRGDGWEYTLQYLKHALAQPGDFEDYQHDAELLGGTTASLHVALAMPTQNRDFAPEPITRSDADVWSRSLDESARQATAELRQRIGELPEKLRPLATSVAEALAAPQSIAHIVEGFAGLAAGDVYKIRVHGDYHLGQVLKTEKSFVIFDFEGEPARPLAERRQKTCVLKDVAGMLRSFDYAANTAAVPNGAGPAAAREWEQTVRNGFWNEYRNFIQLAPVMLLPMGRRGARALAAFEFDKAVYELGYEMHNRPTWIAIPLRGLARILKKGVRD